MAETTPLQVLQQAKTAIQRLLDASFEDHEGMHRFAEDVLPAYAIDGVNAAIASIDACISAGLPAAAPQKHPDAERCRLLDELILSWKDVGNSLEQRERRMQARAAIEAAWPAELVSGLPAAAVPIQPSESPLLTFSLAYMDGVMEGEQPEIQRHWQRVRNAALSSASVQPVDMVLFCPKCGTQHIDAPESDDDYRDKHLAHGGFDDQWTNPPHKSHLCHGCGHIWRPSDVPTNGVAAVKTTGKADSALASPAPAAAASVQPVAWLVHGGRVFVDTVHINRERAERQAAQNTGATVLPLFASPIGGAAVQQSDAGSSHPAAPQTSRTAGQAAPNVPQDGGEG